MPQKYLKPVNGGFASVETGKDFYLVDMKGKDSLQIYNVLLTMVKKSFTGNEDKILETKEGSYIKAYGFSPRGISGYYDAKFEVEFKIKNGRYIFTFPKFSIEANEKTGNKVSRVLIRQGSNFVTPDDYTSYLLKVKDVNKPTIKHKSTYKSLIKYLDMLGSIFDISKTYDQYIKLQEKDKGW
jgi:hypothetical protein